MIVRRGERSRLFSAAVALTRRASHKLRRTSVPFTKPSLDESNRLITICLPCARAEFHSVPRMCDRRGIMWDKLYARKSFRSERERARGKENAAPASFSSCGIAWRVRAYIRDPRNRLAIIGAADQRGEADTPVNDAQPLRTSMPRSKPRRAGLQPPRFIAASQELCLLQIAHRRRRRDLSP